MGLFNNVSFPSYFPTMMSSVNGFGELHWSVKLVVMLVFILSELAVNYIYIIIYIYIYIYVYIYRERAVYIYIYIYIYI